MKPESGRDFPEEWRWLYQEGEKHGIASRAQQIEKITADRDEWKQLAMSIPTKNAELHDAQEALKQLVELKDIKMRIETGTAEDSAVNYYIKNKEHCWTMAREVLKRARRYEKETTRKP